MKKIIYNLAILLCILFIYSCDDMYDIHKKYLDEGETTYLGKAYELKSFGGYERIKLAWKINADPKIEDSYIYWNNRKDSIIVPIDRSDTIMQRIIYLPEGKYQLEMINRNAKGEKSLIETVSAESYGEKYRERLYNRIISNMTTTSNGVSFKLSLEEGCVGTNFYYLDKNGEKKHLFIESNEVLIEVHDVAPGGEFKYNSLYLPEVSAIDSIPSFEDIGSFPYP